MTLFTVAYTITLSLLTPDLNHRYTFSCQSVVSRVGNAALAGVSKYVCFTKSYVWKQHKWEKWTTEGLICGTMHFWKFQMVHQFKMADRETNHDRNKNFLV